MAEMLHTPVFGIALTLVVYYGAIALYKRFRHPLLNTVMISIVVIIGILLVTGISYEAYNVGGRVISFFLGPAVVALAVPLYERLDTIRRNATAILISILAGSVTGIVSAAGIASLLGATRCVIVSVAPKSVTTPIAMGISEQLGGVASLSAVIVIATGVLGAVVGPTLLRIVGVRSLSAFGLAMGAAAHGIGTARASEEGSLAEATGGLAMALNGIVTAVLTPVLLQFIG